MDAITRRLCLQAGGTLNPRQHLYVERNEDRIFLRLLLERQYVNVLASRQMGKSSLMMHAVHQLDAHGVRWITIDLASELGSPPDLNAYYLGLLSKLVRGLRLTLDLKAWWAGRETETINQRLLSFFREVVGEQIVAPVVIFLDEIDSTLKLLYTDDLFTAIRGMYNERSLVEAYCRITFCLLGVATPNELIRDRRTTAYNVGTFLELRDFDSGVDDLSPLATALTADAALSACLLDRVLHWTGGHPYLTQKFCTDIVEKHIDDIDGVDGLVTWAFATLDHARHDIHFQQILGFLEERLSDKAAAIGLYAKILRGERVPDLTTRAHADLKLSGLVKRDRNGNLSVRNPVYRRLFDRAWVESTYPQLTIRNARNYASLAFLVLVGGAAYYAAVVRPEQQRQTLDRLTQAGIAIVQSESGDGTRALLPNMSPEYLRQNVPLLNGLGSITEISLDYSARVDRVFGSSRVAETAEGYNTYRYYYPIDKISEPIIDLSPLADLIGLRTLDLARPLPNIRSLEPLKRLTSLTSLRLNGVRGITTLEPLKELTNLQYLQLDDAAGIASLEPLKDLTNLTSLVLSGATGITSLEPLKGLTNLTWLGLPGATGIRSLEPLKGLTNLEVLSLDGATGITSLDPLKDLTNLTSLSLSDIVGITNLEPIKGFTKLRSLSLSGDTGITSLELLKGLVNLERLVLSDATGITSLEPLKGLTNLTWLGLPGATGIRSLEPLKGLTNLEVLSLDGATGITSLDPLKDLTNLTSLWLTDAVGITNLEPIKGFTKLRSLSLSGDTGITSLESLRGLVNLERLVLSDATGITSLEPLGGLTSMTELWLDGDTGITSLEPLKRLTRLRSLSIDDATGITNLGPLRRLASLRSLSIDGATGIKSLEPLRGRNIRIEGASDELLETMRSGHLP